MPLFRISKDNLITLLWLLCNISSAIGIILVNKLLIETSQFKFVLSLTTLHFACNYLFQELLGVIGVTQFQSNSSTIPLTKFQSIGLAVLGTTSVCSLNLSLTYNSVSLYQIFKLLCIPCMLLLQPFECLKLTWQLLVTLFAVIIGIALATVNDIDFETNSIGLILACIAVLSTSLFQLQTAKLSQANKISPQEMNKTQALPTAIMCALAAFFIDVYPEQASILTFKFTVVSIFLIFATCVISLFVNISAYGILGRCTALTFQVVGQIKTCGVLIGGWIVFPTTREQITFKVIGGIVQACGAALLYFYLKQQDNNVIISNDIPKYELVNLISDNESTIELEQNVKTDKQ